LRDLNGKITGGTLTADEWNDVPSEMQNIIEDQGLVLTSTDLNQMGKAIAGYVANGTFYVDSGIADAYVLSPVGLRQSPPLLTDGFAADFVPGNDNTGASTVNVGGFGVKAIKRPDGADVVGGDIGGLASLKFSAANDWFILVGFVPISSTTNKGIIETATLAEANAGTNTTNALVPSHLPTAIPLNTADASETVKGIVELATDGETIAGTDGARSVTPAGLASFQKSLASNGYQYFPGGLLLQWGVSNVAYDETVTIVNFPLSFPSACLNVTATVNQSSPVNGVLVSAVASFNQTSVSILGEFDVDSASLPTYWQALGY